MRSMSAVSLRLCVFFSVGLHEFLLTDVYCYYYCIRSDLNISS